MVGRAGIAVLLAFAVGVATGWMAQRPVNVTVRPIYATSSVTTTATWMEGQWPTLACSATFSDGQVYSWPAREQGLCLAVDAMRWDVQAR